MIGLRTGANNSGLKVARDVPNRGGSLRQIALGHIAVHRIVFAYLLIFRLALFLSFHSAQNLPYFPEIDSVLTNNTDQVWK